MAEKAPGPTSSAFAAAETGNAARSEFTSMEHYPQMWDLPWLHGESCGPSRRLCLPDGRLCPDFLCFPRLFPCISLSDCMPVKNNYNP